MLGVIIATHPRLPMFLQLHFHFIDQLLSPGEWVIVHVAFGWTCLFNSTHLLPRVEVSFHHPSHTAVSHNWRRTTRGLPIRTVYPS